MSSAFVPFALVIAGTVFTAGHATFRHFAPDAAVWRASARALLYGGLIAVLSASEHVVDTALWLGVVPSLGLASHVWFGPSTALRAPRAAVEGTHHLLPTR